MQVSSDTRTQHEVTIDTGRQSVTLLFQKEEVVGYRVRVPRTHVCSLIRTNKMQRIPRVWKDAERTESNVYFENKLRAALRVTIMS